MQITAERRVTSTEQKTIPRVRVPIRTKLTIPYLVLSIILAVAAAYLITQLVVENVEERFDKQLFEAGKISSELMVGYEMQLLETQRLLANAEGVSSAIVAKDPDTLRSLTLGMIANDQQEAVEFLDLQGNHVLSVRHRGGDIRDDLLQDVFANGRHNQVRRVPTVICLRARADRHWQAVHPTGFHARYIQVEQLNEK